VAWINPRIRPGERRKVVTGIPGKTGGDSNGHFRALDQTQPRQQPVRVRVT